MNRVKRHPADYRPEGSIELLAAILGDTVKLPGARCIGKAELFEPKREDESPQSARRRHDLAAAECAACPALTECREWVASLASRQRPAGVVAMRAPASGASGALSSADESASYGRRASFELPPCP